MESLAEDLHAIEAAGLRRRLREAQGPAEAEIVLDGRRLINFGSNNYLGLASHPDVAAAASRAAERFGTGAGASRLISGNHELYRDVEGGLAALKGTDSSLVFSTGYLANIGTIPALVGESDGLASDRLNHASLIDGCRLSRARLLIYPHADMSRLEEMLSRQRDRYRRFLIVTDGVFSMDGDVAPLPELADLARRHDAWLLVDDAHGTGVLGGTGGGAVEATGTEPFDGLIHMGTLSKAFGGLGGYIAGPAVLREHLINRSRAFIFDTALPASVLGAASAAIALVRAEPWRRARLAELGKRVRVGLRDLGLAVPDGITPIVPIVLGESRTAMRWMERLLVRGVFVPGVRPPTVPQGEARLRVSLMATHTDEQVARLLDACAGVRREEGAP